MLRMNTLNGRKRVSTQELLQTIEAAILRGETEFDILASGQHDIGGPLWNREGKPITFHVRNPGQRVGAMCLPGTTVFVEGPAPADAGWLNSGGHVVVRGDAGDTAAHCAAAGVIHVGGRAGARTGSLMKHDPQYEEPALWVLRTVGDFSFEFMGGGRAVVCGVGCDPAESPLGERPCVGMVGGVVYFRGNAHNLPEDVRLSTVNNEDVSWLKTGLVDFLESVERPELRTELSDWQQWRKITPMPYEQRRRVPVVNMAAFRQDAWVSGGIFSDVLSDDGRLVGLVATAEDRLRMPVWSDTSCRDCQLCLKSCPRKAIERLGENTEIVVYRVQASACVGCGLCAGLCPGGAWKMIDACNA
ncbi:MAG: 4Fe-4S binding protein [Desulfovibrio sp.]|nr:4Fe-4S binding protein [Desulfovibrio sp.]